MFAGLVRETVLPVPESLLVPETSASTRPAPLLHVELVPMPCVDLNQNSIEKSSEIWRVTLA